MNFDPVLTRNQTLGAKLSSLLLCFVTEALLGRNMQPNAMGTQETFSFSNFERISAPLGFCRHFQLSNVNTEQMG